MTFESMLDKLRSNKIEQKAVYDEVNTRDNLKRINYYANLGNITKDPLNDNQLQELNAIVNILQILYNSEIDSPIDDSVYDSLQELLIDMGIPRLTGSIELNNSSKVPHKHTNLRGTLAKVYYLYPTDQRTNKSRKYLDEWIKSMEAAYERKTGKQINLNDEQVVIQPKFDGSSCVLEVEDNMRWITRGDTRNNLASDVSHIMNIFNSQFNNVPKGTGIKFEVMIPEENKEIINELCKNERRYHNSRQIVTAVLNSNEPDFKTEYMYPIPLRITQSDMGIETIHPYLLKLSEICKLSDRDAIREYGLKHRYVEINGLHFRTDGVVITFTNEHLKEVLGRDNDTNNFEVAYKFTEEIAYTKVKNVIFETSMFGYVCPVLVVNDVILKGNTINRISLSNKERFDELQLHYGDEVKILYDIIPYATIDDSCTRVKNGTLIPFIEICPMCGSKLNLDNIRIQCTNQQCPSKTIGRLLNYCINLRIQNIGYRTLEILYNNALLDKGIKSLYRLKNNIKRIEMIDGFGIVKAKKICAEIESKRKLKDYEFFGSLGIEGLSMKTFQLIFSEISLSDFMNMLNNKNYKLMLTKLVSIPGIGNKKASVLVDYLTDKKNLSEIRGLLKEVVLYESIRTQDFSKGRVVFTGCRPTQEIANVLMSHGFEPSDSWSNKAKYLVVPNASYESSKVDKATRAGVPIVIMNSYRWLEKIVEGEERQ